MRRRDLDSLDVTLKDKERTCSALQQTMHDQQMSLLCEQTRLQELQMALSRRAIELTAREVSAEAAKTQCENQTTENTAQSAALTAREETLRALELTLNAQKDAQSHQLLHLQELESRVQDVESQETTLREKIASHSQRENDFYLHTAGEISAMHRKELSGVQLVCEEQRGDCLMTFSGIFLIFFFFLYL